MYSAIKTARSTLSSILVLKDLGRYNWQTLNKFDVDFIQEMVDRYRITICEKMKQTKPESTLALIDLLT